MKALNKNLLKKRISEKQNERILKKKERKKRK